VRDNSPACHNDSSAEEIEEEDEGGNEAAAEDLVSWAGIVRRLMLVRLICVYARGTLNH